MVSSHDNADPASGSPAYSGSDWLIARGAARDGRRERSGDGGPGIGAIARNLGDGLMPLRIAIIALVALVMLGPIMTNVEGGESGEGSIVRQIAYLAILAGTIFAIRPSVTPRSMVALSWPLLVAFAWCWISLSWAIDPGTAFRRVLLTTLVAWMVFSLVRHGGYQLTVDILRYALLATVLISYVVVKLDPMVGVHMTGEDMATALIGNWRGFLGHKNFAGAVCALCIVMFLFDAKRIRLTIRIFAIVIAAYFLFRSQSKTSGGMVVLASIGGVVFETVSIRLRRYIIPILMIVGSVVWFLTSAYADMVQSNFLQPKAFTGRGQIWAALLNYAGDHPMLGAGFGSFWNIESGSPVFEYGQGYVTKITVGHSGYIDQLVTVGIPGVLLMVFAMAVWPLAKLLASENIAKGRGALIAAMLMFCIGHNITESGLFERDGIVSTVFFFAVALAHYCTMDEKRVAPSKQAGDDVMRELRRRKRKHRPVLTAGGAE
ncbi:O-antigen ligase [Sphingomonas sp. OK281]|uniref:O-antigen ligase family protein n=1 Tax=Sphingomonas sp. OK281 TaxID=1881067 RepID=UPI0008E3ADE2|nr:O-antigen ligase family protein [Sphingomonas sp. OK281]SFO29345.1 O-antigen ligase [Sphingomonas sp. OK281]